MQSETEQLKEAFSLLQAENKKLREALEKIANARTPTEHLRNRWSIVDCVAIAEQALAQISTNKGDGK